MKKKDPLIKELLLIERKEKKLEHAAMKAGTTKCESILEEKVPKKVYIGLQSAFQKAFTLVFKKGKVIIEKSYPKENIQKEHMICDYALMIKGGKKEVKQLKKSAKRADALNLALTTIEGIGLGALGIGLPDIIMFLGTLLKGIYETALHYGFDYDNSWEQLWILKMMETSLSTGEEWALKNAEVDEMMHTKASDISKSVFDTQLRQTASKFAVNMLGLKFIQGIPVIGIIGGVSNPIYYNKIMKYVELKYRRRYYQNKMEAKGD